MAEGVRLWHFHGGLKLDSRTARATGEPIAEAPLPGRLVQPLSQHTGQPAERIRQRPGTQDHQQPGQHQQREAPEVDAARGQHREHQGRHEHIEVDAVDGVHVRAEAAPVDKADPHHRRQGKDGEKDALQDRRRVAAHRRGAVIPTRSATARGR